MSKDDRGKGDTTAGVFTGRYACHPLSGRHVPIYLAEYVLTHYGTGVVMGAPAHDSRDLAFAHHHNQEVRSVVGGGSDGSLCNEDEMFTEHGVLRDSGEPRCRRDAPRSALQGTTSSRARVG
ncbi:hypothetical protein PF008_g5041 [Phytophthora fragariae]|uniref:leucine--tRNA ligase n=1 Tax=Phytophthora fragariae TaxID=53985 RepID=A0A6G0S9J6_9STRA|nr:hypothetical protein PF008_g5041 [Phytophthora fragariae]